MSAKKWFCAAIILLLLVGTAVSVFGFLLPYNSAGSGIRASGQLIMEQQPDKSWKLSWPEADGAAFYRIEFFRGAAVGC